MKIIDPMSKKIIEESVDGLKNVTRSRRKKSLRKESTFTSRV